MCVCVNIHIYPLSSSLWCHCVPSLGEGPQHTAFTSAYLALSSARWYPSSSRLVRISIVSPVFP